MRALPYIILALLVYGVLFYLETYEPEVLTTILIQVDVFGVTRVAEAEQQRLAAIKNLTIPYEEKQVLVDRTVFMGATEEMVKLALGEPKKVVERIWEDKDHNKKMLTYYVYYLPGDKRPTILVFEFDNAEYTLVNAYKGSAIDIGN